MKYTSIKVGNKFIKPEDPNIVWVVKQVIKRPGLPPHAELKAQGYLSWTVILPQNALANYHLHHRS